MQRLGGNGSVRLIDGLIDNTIEHTVCPGCGARLSPVDGPVHRYMTSSPACWARYGQVLAREYENPALFGQSHRLTVDAYAVQHPGQPSPQSNQSVAVHLISLYLVLERDWEHGRATDAIKRATRLAPFERLSLPQSFSLTVTCVPLIGSYVEHVLAATQWARAAWDSWAPHHATVANWAEHLL